MRLGLYNGKDNLMLEQDYFIDETNNGWVNGVPARVANTQMNDLVRQMEIERELQRQGYKEPRNMMEALYMMFNSGRQMPQRKQRRQYFPYAMGF